MGLFGKTLTPEEAIKKWKRELRKEERTLDRSIREIANQERKTEIEIKKLAKKKDMGSAKILAKELVRSRKARERLYKSKAQIHGVEMQLTQQGATLRLQKTMAKSAAVMTAMNSLVKLPQLNAQMMAMAREMEKAGLIDEMIGDTLDDDEELSEEADVQMEMVLDEILSGVKAAPVASGQLPERDSVKDAADDELVNRLAALN
mmetsp:Transcript_14190/g.44676  ORF Transcript_14190/g.44676 Transcript_14190/m.44676 type:complete len:204 (-) Transcript_14190:99-710(-)|eukprot:CAMPEP_0170756964 /NCGR_PEP_ID=MMETSP0437-20130122/14291_1 /TAXON_ID=0 /ORGANISM="Sexangularia sp." /LENGTH=203 /DNA_ID=CAMNT_0011096153 /DNA_START=72 /DNA_END=683 /DNA_ORIENTATION=+